MKQAAFFGADGFSSGQGEGVTASPDEFPNTQALKCGRGDREGDKETALCCVLPAPVTATQVNVRICKYFIIKSSGVNTDFLPSCCAFMALIFKYKNVSDREVLGLPSPLQRPVPEQGKETKAQRGEETGLRAKEQCLESVSESQMKPFPVHTSMEAGLCSFKWWQLAFQQNCTNKTLITRASGPMS